MADEGAVLAAELARRTEAEAAMAAALVELERHPGHLTLSSGATTGGAAETVETITLDALATRMDAAFREVGDVVTTCDAVQRAVFAALVPTADQAGAALATARDLDPDGVDPDVGPLTAALAEVEQACVHDPLALADRPTSDVLAPLQDALDAVARRCGELVAVRDGWAAGLETLAAALTAAEALRDEVERAQHVARELIAGADLIAADPVPHLRERLAALPTVAGWAARAAALADLRAAIAAATARLRTAADEAEGLVERRSELRGRFEAYRAKAGRLGVVERPDLLAAGDRVRDLLWTRPCDLAGATVALVDYQRLIRDGGCRA